MIPGIRLISPPVSEIATKRNDPWAGGPVGIGT